MGSQQAGKNLIDELAANKDAIINNLPWKEIDDKEKIERLREYTKSVLNSYAQHYTQIIEGLLERINQLERHKHDATGRAIIEKHLDEGKPISESIGMPLQNPGAYAIKPPLFKTGINSNYI